MDNDFNLNAWASQSPLSRAANLPFPYPDMDNGFALAPPPPPFTASSPFHTSNNPNPFAEPQQLSNGDWTSFESSPWIPQPNFQATDGQPAVIPLWQPSQTTPAIDWGSFDFSIDAPMQPWVFQAEEGVAG